MEGLVDPLLKGYSAFNQDVAVFDFADVIVARNYKEIDRVRLVSGGTCSHIKYVGKGMLTASIQGSGQNPPTSSAILRTLRELSVNHVKGILVIVQASSTDILNFGVAVERADNDDLRVQFILVADDSQNSELSTVDQRGLSGIVLVNKIAGALAENNFSISHIHEYCKNVADNLITASTSVKKMLLTRECFYCKMCSRGISETPHKKRSILKKVSFIDIMGEVTSYLLTTITANKNFWQTADISLVLLVNNMGALNDKQEHLFFKECVEFLSISNIKIARFYIGSYLQLNNDADLTLTVLKVFDDGLLPLLDYPCSVPGWKLVTQSEPFISFNNNVIPGCLRRKCRLSPPTKGPKLDARTTNVLQLCLQFACEALISCEKMLNKMDSEKGDGDTGTRLRTVAEVMNKRICTKKLVMDYPFTFLISISKLLENAVGSTLGCIYCIMFEAAANKFGGYKEEDEVNVLMWLEALENACAAVKRYGHAEEGDKTMYDPLQACATVIRQNITTTNPLSVFGMGVAKAEETAQNTKQPGRKYPDPGAHAVGIWLRAVYEGVKLKLFE